MGIISRNIVVEFVFLVISFGLTISIASYFFDWKLFEADLNLHLQDTYFAFLVMDDSNPTFFAV
jgi:hypothetical protein